MKPDASKPYQSTSHGQNSPPQHPVGGSAEVYRTEPLDGAWRFGASAEPDRRDGGSPRHEHADPAVNRRIRKIMRKVCDFGSHRRIWIDVAGRMRPIREGRS